MGLRQDVEVENETSGFVIASIAMAKRPSQKSAGSNWERLVSQAALIALELYQDDPFVVRVLVEEPLTHEEDRLWIHRIGAKLHLPRPGMALCGGREYVDDPDDSDIEAVEISVPAGTYAVDIHVYVTGPGYLRQREISPDHLPDPSDADAVRYVDFVVRLSEWHEGFDVTPCGADGWIPCQSPSRISDGTREGLISVGLDIPNSLPQNEATPPPGRRHVRIVAVPAGDAPAWVRKAWMGLVLPLAPDAPEGRVLIYSHEAVAVLSRENKEAAMWWKTNQPRACRALGLTFEFAAKDCEAC